MCELIVKIEEKRPKSMDVNLHISDGEGVTAWERHTAVALSDLLDRWLRMAAQLLSFKEESK